jgi:hypothetical protein
MRYSRRFGGLGLKTTQRYGLWMTGFAEFRPQNSVAAVLEETDGGMWHNSEGCVKTKQLRVERGPSDKKPKSWSIFAPGGMDSLYVNRGSLVNRNNLL